MPFGVDGDIWKLADFGESGMATFVATRVGEALGGRLDGGGGEDMDFRASGEEERGAAVCWL